MLREASYDEVIYPGFAFAFTHPDSLATNAWLRGLPVPDIANARVIELGCSDGGNLIAMAATMPGARFLGIDLAPSAIARGRERVAALGLANIDLQVGDIMTLAPRERFDFVIAHGVYSWVPEPVRRRLLELYAALLSDHGLGFLSFLAFPGGHFTGLVRGLARIHAQPTSGGDGAARAVRDLGRTLIEVMTGDDPVRAVVRKEAQGLIALNETVMVHDVLGAENHYEWLVEIAAKLAVVGLQYAADADHEPLVVTDGEPAAARLIALAGDDPLLRAQYLDFARLTRFRRIVVARAGTQPAPRPIAARLYELRLQGEISPTEGSPSLARGVEAAFRDRVGNQLRLDDPLAKAAIIAIGAAFPRGLTYADVVAASVAAVRAAGADQDLERDPAAHIAPILVELLGGNLLRPHILAPPVPATPGERPCVAAFARYQLARDVCATNLWHEAIEFDPPGCRLIQLMDGTRDRAALAEAMGVDRETLEGMITAVHRRSMLITTS